MENGRGRPAQMVKRLLRKLASFNEQWNDSASRQDFFRAEFLMKTVQMRDLESLKYEGYFDMRKEEMKSMLLRQKKII